MAVFTGDDEPVSAAIACQNKCETHRARLHAVRMHAFCV